jgi:hypothetical protein
MNKAICIILFSLISLQAFGTAQIPDKIIYRGDTLSLFGCPLEYLRNTLPVNSDNLFGSSGCFYTACYRGYVATWEVIDNRLYLNSIRNACYPASLDYVEVSAIDVSAKPGALRPARRTPRTPYPAPIFR